MADQPRDVAADMLDLDHQYLAGYRCMACIRRFYLPSNDSADAIIAGLCCPRCGVKDRCIPSGWAELIKVRPAPTLKKNG